MLKRNCHIVIVLVLVLAAAAACTKEQDYRYSERAVLDFSCDTMAFDTVFTQMGTTTRQFKVYNRGSEDVLIDAVTLQGDNQSRFRLNVDGDTSMVARHVAIAAGDSIFVFVRANINPNSATEPFLIEDAIEFRITSANIQRLPLMAYGRNAVYHIPTDTLHYADGTQPLDMFGRPYAYSVIDCSHWDHSLPHVVLGYAVVDEDSVLSLTAGDELYFCEDAVLWVYDGGTLDVRGTAEQPVLFTSVRHDGWYDYLPGQWGYVWLSSGSVDNYVDHAEVENGYVGFLADSCANSRPTLTISNTRVRNQTLAGILGQTAMIDGRNLLVTNCGTATVAMQYGGSYRFEGCTFADYWRYDSRTDPSVYITNTRDYGGVHYVWPLQAHLTDCIIYGSRTEGELYVDLDPHAQTDTLFHHCLIRGGSWDEDPQFADVENGDYSLKEGSPAAGIGWHDPKAITPNP